MIVARVRALLWFRPYATVRATLAGTSDTPRENSDISTDTIVRDVARAARIVPGATCLVQALAAEWLLTRAGVASTVRFGVARGEGGFEAHAWLETRGCVVLGGETAGRFAPLLARDPPTR